jgi:hypothetical protein|tara:strand:- start:395 stop:628 length:234 start_codon:yes stop_codon:yes gene_type:complete
MPDNGRTFPLQNLYKSEKKQKARPRHGFTRDLVIAKTENICYNVSIKGITPVSNQALPLYQSNILGVINHGRTTFGN